MMNILIYLQSFFPKYIEYGFNAIQKHFFCKLDKINLFMALLFFKNHYNIKTNMIIDISAVDFIKLESRFSIIYQVLSMEYQFRLFIKIFTSEYNNIISSISSLFPMSSWYEREIHEFFGIFFDGNSDLRKLLMDYEIIGYPLRKDFPLSGFFEIEYAERERMITYKEISMIQEYRTYNFKDPWPYFNNC